jgi:hypothetical protein
VVPALEVHVRDLLDLRETGTPKTLQTLEKARDVLVGQPVVDVGPLAPRLDEACLAERAEVRARVLDGGFRLLGERLDGLLALAQEVEQLEPRRAGDGVAKPGELGVDGTLEFAVRHGGRGSEDADVHECALLTTF